VADPYDQDDSVFESCFAHISASVRPLLPLLEAVEGQ
jgi:hypothetical protein